MVTLTARQATAVIALADGVMKIRIRGRLDGPTLLELIAQLPQHIGDLRYGAVLVDLSGADASAVGSEDVRQTALLPPMHVLASKYAMVVPDDLGFGLARMFSALRDSKHPVTQVFRHLEEAERWLAGDEATDPSLAPEPAPDPSP